MTADAEWIALLLAGDAAAIAQVRTWVGAALARYRNRLGAEVEDLEQEVLLDLMEALAAGRFRQQSRLETYVHAFARYKCVDRLRVLGRRDMVEIDEEALAFDAPSALDELAQRETAALAARIAAALPAPCRELWEMIADGMSYRQMSGATGLSEGAIRVRVHRCRQRAIELRLRLLAGEDL
ncbi:MAG TPA: sigma-70 family RNA polymerase sigma factor [Thermoanaerobaculia bacterium]|nr:sigma-70 family RNA polymerase sigma factor [Thermoanaerobaculia bacterium]HXT52481.1 sigma-70 family RNA polymerase sigma factor [Thermoanaerobaculia bacterium]